MARSVRLLGALVACLLLAGCSEVELYTGLSEREANDMAAVLKSARMDAEKSTKDGKTWTLMAPKSEFAQAIALLEARGLPKERFESLGDVFKKDGFISSPVEEHARLIFGLSQELSNTISTMDGVVVARVHIAMPDPDPLAETSKPSSASVFIKYDPQVDISSQIGPIKSLLVNSVEGLPYERVSVVLTPARSLAAAPTPVPAMAGSPPAPAVVLWIVGALVSAAAALGLWLRNDVRRRRLA